MDRVDVTSWKNPDVVRLLALFEAEKQANREILACLPAGIAVIARDRSIRVANREFRRTFGLQAGNVACQSISHLIDSPEFEAALERAMAGHEARNDVAVAGPAAPLRISVCRMRRREEDGEPEALVMVVPDGAGSFAPTSAGGEDGDARPFPEPEPEPEPQSFIEAQPAAEPQPEPPAEVELTGLPVVAWSADPNTLSFTAASGGTDVVPGYSISQWTDTPGFWLLRIHPDDRDATLSFLRSACARPGIHSCEFRAVAEDGRTIWLRDTFRVPEGGGVITGTTADVTARRTLEEHAVCGGRVDALAGLCRTLTHDINNPLMIITGYGEELLALVPEDGPERADLEQLVDAGNRITSLTTQLLSFTRKQAQPAEPVKVAPILGRLCERLRAERPGIEFVRGDEDSLGVSANEAQLESGLTAAARHLLDEEPGTTRVSLVTSRFTAPEHIRGLNTLRAGEYVVIRLAATGPNGPTCGGMRRLLSGRDSGEYAIELARTFQILPEWGGSIAPTSPPGATAYDFYLCAATIEAPESPAPEPAPPAVVEPDQPEAETILVVEDEAGIRSLVRKILRRHGYDVLEAGSAAEAVQVASAFGKPLALLIADLELPDRGGRLIARELSENQPELKVLFVSGYTEESAVEHGDAANGVPFLQKPFTLGSLLAKVRSVIAGSPNPTAV